jgi:hypothetical protein
MDDELITQNLRELVWMGCQAEGKFNGELAAFDALAAKASRTDALELMLKGEIGLKEIAEARLREWCDKATALEAENAALVKERDGAHTEIERLKNRIHASDCATHNEPYMRNGPCDCGVDKAHDKAAQAACTCGSSLGHTRTCAAFDESMMRYEPFSNTAPQQASTCPACNGTGDDFGDFACQVCGGTGIAAPQQASEQRAAVDDSDAICQCGLHAASTKCPYEPDSPPVPSAPVGLTDHQRAVLLAFADRVEEAKDQPIPVAHTAAALFREIAAHPVTKAASDGVALTAAARDVLAERQRQVSAEGWTPEHDDEHDIGEMADAAASYALHASGWTETIPGGIWPADWSQKWWKPTTPRRNLVKSGALILAEIERIDRRDSDKEGQS